MEIFYIHIYIPFHPDMGGVREGTWKNGVKEVVLYCIRYGLSDWVDREICIHIGYVYINFHLVLLYPVLYYIYTSHTRISNYPYFRRNKCAETIYTVIRYC